MKQQVSVRLQKTDFSAKYKCLFPLRLDNIFHVVIQSGIQIECLTNHQPYDMLLRLNDVDQSESLVEPLPRFTLYARLNEARTHGKIVI